MNAEAIVQQLLADSAAFTTLPVPLPETIAQPVVERLKQEADRHWWINANRSLEIADLIVQIGQAQADPRHIALGLMARGDALKLLGQINIAWDTLEQAGALFQSAGDEIGWARTRIGRLPICVDLHRVSEALNDAEQARAIFTRYQEHEKLLRLDLNNAIVYDLLGDYHQGLRLYHSALATAERLGETGQSYFGLLYTNMGYAFNFLGEYRQALACYERARHSFAERQEMSGVAVAELNIAYIAQAQGQYRYALTLLHRVLDLVTDHLPRETASAKRVMVECYLYLNRFREAGNLAQTILTQHRALNATYETARTLLHLATAEAELGNLARAQAALDSAEAVFSSLGATTWTATVQLRRARIMLQQGDRASAYHVASVVAQQFEMSGQQANYAAALLLQGQVLFAEGDLDTARQIGSGTLQIAKSCNIPSLRYAAHTLVGKIAEAQGRLRRAIRCYQAAAATVERMQRGLTMTMRPEFLEDKGDALRALIGLHLRMQRADRALETLERAKSHVFLNYLANHGHFRWASEDARQRVLIEEFEQLRAEHHWFYRIAHNLPINVEGRASTFSPQQALLEVAHREHRMRAIIERLYLTSPEDRAFNRLHPLSLNDIQAYLSEEMVLIEFYDDGTHFWAFTLDTQTLRVHPLTATAGELDRVLTQLQLNITAALAIDPTTSAMRNLTVLGQRILQRLFSHLMAPLASVFEGRQQLVIVPYGMLHYFPFHLLHTGRHYLVEQHEIVILPTAGLIAQPGLRRPPGAVVLTHSWDGRLPQTQAEGQLVQQLLGGAIYCEQAATRTVLQAQPTQVLHIATHGQHRLDQPDLSFIELADGQLYTDDLLQHDLSYELVTLSACETGRAKVAASDELIGLGRGFLYAGASALVVSLWPVIDTTAATLMGHMYRILRSGASKAAALRDAQRALLAENPWLHPASWGAFQLVGDPRPLSQWPSIEHNKED